MSDIILDQMKDDLTLLAKSIIRGHPDMRIGVIYWLRHEMEALIGIDILRTSCPWAIKDPDLDPERTCTIGWLAINYKTLHLICGSNLVDEWYSWDLNNPDFCPEQICEVMLKEV